MSFSRQLFSIAGLALLGVSTAFGQALPDSVLACAAQKKDSARLACFDREIARLAPLVSSVAPTPVAPASNVPSPPPVAATPPQNATPTADDFGVSGRLAKQRAATQETAKEPPKELRATVTKVTAKFYGELVLELDNGQVWEQPEKKSTFQIKSGEGVLIRQHKLGSFFLTADSGATTRIRRVR